MDQIEAEQRYARTSVDGIPLFYDRVERRMVHEITDYALHLHDLRGLKLLTVEQETTNLLCFWKFLRADNRHIQSINDRFLARFRDEELQLVLSQPSSKGCERTAKTTVNQKLRSVYGWLWWLVDAGVSDANLIGPNGCRVLSGGGAMSGARTAKPAFLMRATHPLLFTGTGASSKHRTAFEATPVIFDAVTQAIMDSARSEYVRVRDCLFLDVARHVGFRRGSIASLAVDQFDREKLIAHQKNTIRISPSSQKFGYSNAFEFPVWLALQLADFIDGARKQLLEKHGISEDRAPGEIFLSDRSCKPITLRAITQSIRPAMRACGAPKGAVIHVFRGLFANEAVDREIEYRVKRGLDTSTIAICAAVGLKLGHRNYMSLFAYVTQAQSRHGLEASTEATKEIRELRRRIKELEAELGERDLAAK